MTEKHDHIPVLAAEVLQHLKNTNAKCVLDGTFGVGALTRLILESTNAHIYALDRDPDAIERAINLQKNYPKRIVVMQGLFSHLTTLLKQHQPKLDAAIFDCGVSSPQIDQAERGFSFQKDGPLDMRMSKYGVSASQIVNNWSLEDLANVIKEFGEERHAKKVAKAIVFYREKKLFERTKELSDVIASVVPRVGRIHPATKTFQGIRMAVNNEIPEITSAIHNTLPFLQDEGSLIMITFHSLEHKAVKRALEDFAPKNPGISRYVPPAPQTRYEKDFFLSGLKKCIKPTNNEKEQNERARSAQMRICIKHATKGPTYEPQ